MEAEHQDDGKRLLYRVGGNNYKISLSHLGVLFFSFFLLLRSVSSSSPSCSSTDCGGDRKEESVEIPPQAKMVTNKMWKISFGRHPINYSNNFEDELALKDDLLRHQSSLEDYRPHRFSHRSTLPEWRNAAEGESRRIPEIGKSKDRLFRCFGCGGSAWRNTGSEERHHGEKFLFHAVHVDKGFDSITKRPYHHSILAVKIVPQKRTAFTPAGNSSAGGELIGEGRGSSNYSEERDSVWGVPGVVMLNKLGAGFKPFEWKSRNENVSKNSVLYKRRRNVHHHLHHHHLHHRRERLGSKSVKRIASRSQTEKANTKRKRRYRNTFRHSAKSNRKSNHSSGRFEEEEEESFAKRFFSSTSQEKRSTRDGTNS